MQAMQEELIQVAEEILETLPEPQRQKYRLVKEAVMQRHLAKIQQQKRAAQKPPTMSTAIQHEEDPVPTMQTGCQAQPDQMQNSTQTDQTIFVQIETQTDAVKTELQSIQEALQCILQKLKPSAPMQSIKNQLLIITGAIITFQKQVALLQDKQIQTTQLEEQLEKANAYIKKIGLQLERHQQLVSLNEQLTKNLEERDQKLQTLAQKLREDETLQAKMKQAYEAATKALHEQHIKCMEVKEKQIEELCQRLAGALRHGIFEEDSSLQRVSLMEKSV